MSSDAHTSVASPDPLLGEILLALQASGVSAREFGVSVSNDTALVGKMKRGRQIKSKSLRFAIYEQIALLKKRSK